MKPNWTDIDKCPIWKVLGVIECNYCPTANQCWRPETRLEKVIAPEEWEKSALNRAIVNYFQ